jgi:hypothetical protein
MSNANDDIFVNTTIENLSFLFSVARVENVTEKTFFGSTSPNTHPNPETDGYN